MQKKQEIKKTVQQKNSPSKSSKFNLENPDVDDTIGDIEDEVNDDTDPNIKEYAMLMLTGGKVSRELAEKIGIKCGDRVTAEMIAQGYAQKRGGGMICVCGDPRCGIGPFTRVQS